tara:strand:- start:1155 stop:1385 length:231 start_codon:yes stop_codon:yes gene_type:complete
MNKWVVNRASAEDLEKMLNKISVEQEVVSVFTPSMSFVVLSRWKGGVEPKEEVIEEVTVEQGGMKRVKSWFRRGGK